MKAGTVLPGPLLSRLSALSLVVALSGGCSVLSGTDPATHTGEELYNNNCAPCHGIDGGGSSLAKAPVIAGLPAWYVKNQLGGFRTGYRGMHYDDVQGMRMRPMALTLAEDEVDLVVAHVGELAPKPPESSLEGGDAAKGATYYAVCQACHGPDGKGNEQLNAPPLVATNDWYLLNQLKNFKGAVRGGNPGDTRGKQMVGMAATLPDEQAMKDVLAHVANLRK